jgi:hypothetical protein
VNIPKKFAGFVTCEAVKLASLAPHIEPNDSVRRRACRAAERAAMQATIFFTELQAAKFAAKFGRRWRIHEASHRQ